MADDKPRKRLPVLGAASQDEARPRWHWSIIVGLGTLFGWLLLEMIAVARLTEPMERGEHHTLSAVVHLVALALPAAGGGALAGRVGKRARMVDALAGAVGLVALVTVISVLRASADAVWLGALALAATTAGGAAAIGFALGRRKPKHEA